MGTILFSDNADKALAGMSAIATSSAPVLGSNTLGAVGTVISTLASTLRLAKDRSWVDLKHPVLQPHLTQNESAQRAKIESLETIQLRLNSIQMAFEEYQFSTSLACSLSIAAMSTVLPRLSRANFDFLLTTR